MGFAAVAPDLKDPTVAVQSAPRTPYVPPKKYSEEQLEIIHCKAPIVVGQAFAGTGKSTTGIGYAAHHPHERILVICFNKANAEEGRYKYPSVSRNVDVLTTHALARQMLTPEQSARVPDRWSSVTLRSELPYVGGRGDMRTAAITASLLTEFFMTTHSKVDPHIHGKQARRVYNPTDSTLEQCAIYAQRLWFAMCTNKVLPGMKSEVNTISIPHDAYLKMFVMTSGNLGYDTVIFDEAQDANPIMLRLLENQYTTGTKVIMLGDRHQAIYEFRGAVNALENLPSEAKVLPLTQSWRFGPKTAAVANFILSELKGETLEIQGMGQDRPYEPGAPLAYLSRTNADLLWRAASANGEGVHWVGGIDGYRISELNDVWALRCGRHDQIASHFIKKHFRSWADFEAAAKNDQETKTLFKIVEEYGDRLPSLVENFRKNKVDDPSKASLVLTTAHRSKGLEWDHVKIADDFRNVFKTAESWMSGKEVPYPVQEINLMYVLSTRPRHSLTPNYEMEEWFDNIDSYRRRRKRSFSSAESEYASEGSTDSVPQSRAARAFANVKPFKMPGARAG